MKTTPGRQRQRTFALTDDQEILASAEQYDLTGVFDGQVVRICGIGWMQGDRRHVSQLVERLFGAAARERMEIGVLFSDSSTTTSEADSNRSGSPMRHSGSRSHRVTGLR
jgi:hypothetical protein